MGVLSVQSLQVFQFVTGPINCPLLDLCLPPLILCLQLAKAPTPLAYFPLTSGSLESLLLPAYNGSLSGIPLPTWHQDPTFGSVINCTRVRACRREEWGQLARVRLHLG